MAWKIAREEYVETTLPVELSFEHSVAGGDLLQKISQRWLYRTSYEE
jgi:hypothetical protein